MDFPQNPETFVGQWVKEGHRAGHLQTRELMKCSFCKEDQAKRECRVEQKLRSYRVIGSTNDSCWDWPEGVCNNPTRCWGRYIRNWTVTRTTNGQWVFRTSLSEPQETRRSSLLDELRCTMEQGTGKNRLVYSGIAAGRHCQSFWPLIPSKSKSPARKIIIKMRSGEPVPSNGNKMFPEYIFPNHIGTHLY